MDRTAKEKAAEAANRSMNAPQDAGQNRRESETRSAMTPSSGAPVQHAFAGAELAAESRAGGASETDEAIKRAAGNDRRV